MKIMCLLCPVELNTVKVVNVNRDMPKYISGVSYRISLVFIWTSLAPDDCNFSFTKAIDLPIVCVCSCVSVGERPEHLHL